MKKILLFVFVALSLSVCAFADTTGCAVCADMQVYGYDGCTTVTVNTMDASGYAESCSEWSYGGWTFCFENGVCGEEPSNFASNSTQETQDFRYLRAARRLQTFLAVAKDREGRRYATDREVQVIVARAVEAASAEATFNVFRTEVETRTGVQFTPYRAGVPSVTATLATP